MSMVIHSRSGPDSMLHLEIPVEQPDTDFEVEVVIRTKNKDGKGWPPGYFDLFGSIDDETFMVHPQPPMPPPAVEFE
jgi:hypothetical protein